MVTHLVRFRRVLFASEATAGGDREEFSPLKLAQVCAAMAFYLSTSASTDRYGHSWSWNPRRH